MQAVKHHAFEIYKMRRDELVERIRAAYPDKNHGAIMLCGSFEGGRTLFRQDSSFFYYTGIEEPGTMAWIDFSGKTTLFVPSFKIDRTIWMVTPDPALVPGHEKDFLCDSLEWAGDPMPGYQATRFFEKNHYKNIIEKISALSAKNGVLYAALCDDDRFFEQRCTIDRFSSIIGAQFPSLVSIAPLIGQMRRIKSTHEVECMSVAIEITRNAQEAASQSIEHDVNEADVHGAVDFIITASSGRIAFPSIIASGPYATVLHYSANNRFMKSGDLVVVDIGAEYGMYCADITRTYPVSGKFSHRQRDIYSLVLELQQYLGDIVQPGWWISNARYPEKSLNHCARAFLAKKGYEKYFPHGIGHYLGLDVHDVGDYTLPLAEGDVITIEPGIYIPQENLGVRIEDNYLIVKNGAVCLSEDIPKTIDEVEGLMEKIQDEKESDDIDFDESYDEDENETCC